MMNFVHSKEDLLNLVKSLKTELWQRLRNPAESDSKKAGIVLSFIERSEKIINDISLLFNDLEGEFGQKPEKFSPSSRNNEVIVFVKNGKPVKINIFGEEIGIRYYREVPISIANWLLDHGKTLVGLPDLDFIQRNKADFKMESADPKPLKNGLLIEVGDDRNRLLYKAQKLLKATGSQAVMRVREDGKESA